MPEAPPIVSADTLRSYAEGAGLDALQDYVVPEEEGPKRDQVTIVLGLAEQIGHAFVGRPLRVRLVEEIRDALDPRFGLYSGVVRDRIRVDGPVVAVVEPEGATIGAGATSIVAPDDAPYRVAGNTLVYWSGWRGEDEDTATLRTYDDLGDLPEAAVVPMLPYDLTAAVCETALWVLGRVRGGHVGQQTLTVQTAQASTTKRGFTLNDVNQLTGRGNEVAAIWETYCGSRRPAHV